MVAFGLIHAALPSHRASAIVGVLSAILNNIYFASVGFVLVYSHLATQLEVPDPSNKADESLNLMFAGAIILTVSWSFSQILVVFFKQSRQTQSKNWWILIIDVYKVLTSSDSEVWARFGRLFTFTEVIRLLSIPAVALSATGWGVFVAGLHNYTQSISLGSPSTLSVFAIWGSIIITPLAFLIAILHAGSSRSDTIFGILVSILNTFVMVCVGFLVTVAGLTVYVYKESLLNSDLSHNINLMFGGGIVCLLFWTALVVLSQFYAYSFRSARPGSTGDQIQLSTLAHHDTTVHNAATHDQIEPPPAYEYEQPSTVQQEKNMVIDIAV